jgi:uncharacterized Zn finger protein (UPF0148 family)
MTRTTCPNCGAPWEGLEMTGTVGAMHFTSNCCGCSEEYLAKLEASPTVALSVRLAEIENWARKGYDLSPSDTLDLITELRRYMAFAEEINHRTESMLKVLGGHE